MRPLTTSFTCSRIARLSQSAGIRDTVGFKPGSGTTFPPTGLRTTFAASKFRKGPGRAGTALSSIAHR